MAVLLVLAYAALCVLVFRVLHVPVNRWTVTSGGLGGVLLVGGLLAGMNYNHPFTTDARIYFYTTPITPVVQGPVVEVAAKPNVAIKQGELLFRVDPRPYQYAVDQKRAALANAVQNVKQLKASVDQAEAGSRRAQAQFELAEQSYKRQADLVKKQVISEAHFDVATRNLESARQAVAEAQAETAKARLAFSSDIDGVNTEVASLQAQLKAAEYDLAHTDVVAPTNGYVAQMLLRPGMTVSPATPTMVFIHADDLVFAAAFEQTAIPRLQMGNAAEAIFYAAPGQVFAGKVSVFAEAVAEGQLQSTGNLINPASLNGTAGEVLVRIELDQAIGSLRLPPGGAAQVAVYSDHWKPVAAVRRILLRMKSWLNYVVRA